jgi:hypothetical protein
MDAHFDRILELRLPDSGIKFWVDYQRITPILPIEQQIDDGIERSLGVVFLDSRQSRVSRWVRMEEKIAVTYRKPCIKCRVGFSDVDVIREWTAPLQS